VIQKSCPVCGTIFWRRDNRNRCCSKRCGSIFAAKRLGPQTCPACGQAFQPKESTQRYCNRQCVRKAMQQRYTRDNAPAWKGGRHHLPSGYVRVRAPSHPRAHKNGYVLEHIIVMEQTLGRHLLPNERVHHLNGVRDDNRPTNLELWRIKDPPGIRASDYHCPGCQCPGLRANPSGPER
jgi:HNH endonuclease